MEKIKKADRIKYKLCFFTGLIIGIIIGVSALSILVSYRMDFYYTNIAYLENKIKDKDARLEKLENTINTQNLVLEDIVVILIFEGDEMDKIEMEKNIKEKYSALLGKEIKSIDVDIIAEIIDKRIFKMEEREYKLHVNKLVLSEILKLWVEIEGMP